MNTFKEKNDFAHSYLICRFDSCLLIDPSHDYEDIIAALMGRTLLGILLTHAHQDHIHLIGEFDVPIYMHTDDAHLLFEDQYNGYAPKAHPYKRKNLNFIYVKHLDKIPLADHFVTVYYTPGHTKGGLCFLYEQRLFTGDTLFKESVGRHDLYSGNLVELRKSILMLCSLPGNIKIYPGHDEISTIRYETKNNPFYLKWVKQSQK
ncbi:MAG: MBL fold metallo-hydrolase [Tenericutes bacterium HGW-Tenericutes-2]|jgi:glyoxylase-like metal-dependent hydrolase (beta-lactamase superfamily II)|nr:MAG: MBL fold metallo-hydrolase [Tenericutes bacterium HGW-Tenericutes-2]